MSLIDEALRRARQEAARQDAARQEERYRQVPVLPPTAAMATRTGGCSRPALIGAAVAACVAAGIGIGIYLGRAPEAPQPQVTAAPAAPSIPAPEAPQPPPAVMDAVMEVIPEETPEPEPTAVPLPTPEPEVPQQIPVTEQETLEPPPALDTPPPAPEPTPEPAPVPEIRTYVREVPLPGGGTLRLNGIAFSAAQPVALIDDKVLGKGEGYLGFIVTDIQANLVELRGNGMTVRVSLK